MRAARLRWYLGPRAPSAQIVLIKGRPHSPFPSPQTEKSKTATVLSTNLIKITFYNQPLSSIDEWFYWWRKQQYQNWNELYYWFISTSIVGPTISLRFGEWGGGRAGGRNCKKCTTDQDEKQWIRHVEKRCFTTQCEPSGTQPLVWLAGPGSKIPTKPCGSHNKHGGSEDDLIKASRLVVLKTTKRRLKWPPGIVEGIVIGL